MKGKVSVLLLAGLFVAAAVGLSGCFQAADRTFVPIDYNDYNPTVSNELSWYRGKSIYLMNVINDAQNTSLYAYYSPGDEYMYGDPNSGIGGLGGRPLESYFWYAFQKALLQAGMRVYSMSNPNYDAPAVQFTMVRINDEVFEWNVEVFEGGGTRATFSENYPIAGPPVDPADRTPERLERRAYDMINKTLAVVFTDPEFRRAFAQAGR
jgi:hypothetical protein